MPRAIALAGSGGSHPATIRAIVEQLHAIAPDRPVVVLDLSAMDARGAASYAGLPAEVIAVTPKLVGLPALFKTAAPNLLLGGGTRAFARMTRRLAALLRDRNVGAMLICHNHGYPEQAILRACAEHAIPLAQIDEGPFSGLVTGTFRRKRSFRPDRVLARLGILPARDQTGRSHALLFPTSPARARTLLDRGIAPERIALVGSPRFDPLAAAAERWRKRAPDPEGRTRVLILHQPFGRDAKVRADAAAAAERTLVDGLAMAARDRPLRITLRAHPRSDATELARLEALLAPLSGAEVSMHEPLYDQFERHDLACGFYSSALLEAAACGLPCVSVLISRDAFGRAGEGAKPAAMASLGIATVTEPGPVAAFVAAECGEASTSHPMLFDRAIGDLTGRAAADVAKRLVELGG